MSSQWRLPPSALVLNNPIVKRCENIGAGPSNPATPEFVPRTTLPSDARHHGAHAQWGTSIDHAAGRPARRSVGEVRSLNFTGDRRIEPVEEVDLFPDRAEEQFGEVAA